MKNIKILLVGDHELFRRGLRSVLEQEEDMEVIGGCPSAEEALNQTKKLSPDVVIMDTHMPRMDAIEGISLLKAGGFNAGVNVVALADGANYRHRAYVAGAAGCVLKEAESHELIRTVRRVAVSKETPLQLWR